MWPSKYTLTLELPDHSLGLWNSVLESSEKPGKERCRDSARRESEWKRCEEIGNVPNKIFRIVLKSHSQMERHE